MSQAESPAPTPTAHTGITQNMDDLHFPIYEDMASQTVEILIEKEDPEVDIGNQAFCLVVSRTGADGQAKIKPFVVPSSFFVISESSSIVERERVQKKIDDIAAPYTLNQYSVQKQAFKVPFTVDVIARVSKGYVNTTPKPLAVEDVQISVDDADVVKKSRKRAAEDDEPSCKRRRD
jgi:hypothetical protein